MMLDPERFPLGESGVQDSSLAVAVGGAPKTLQERRSIPGNKKLSINLSPEEIPPGSFAVQNGVVPISPTTPSSPSRRRPPRCIQEISNFADVYTLGKEVMPSTHRYMTVNFGTRISDGLECVIKIRSKPHCFKSKADERTWRRTTEYLLNMPDSGNLAYIYEVLEDSEALYIVMERVCGMDLFETLAQEYVSVETTREIMRQLLRAIGHLHAHSALHKDLKLENVMIDASPKHTRRPSLTPTSVKLVDFDTIDCWTPSTPSTKDVVGTDQYISQEAYAGKYSPLSDIFAVGVISFKLLSGKFPFHEQIFDDEEGENWVGSPKMEEIREKLKSSTIDFSHSVFKKYPKAADLVKRMLSHNEKIRPRAVDALRHPWFHECEEDGQPPVPEPFDLCAAKVIPGRSDLEVLEVRSRSALPEDIDVVVQETNSSTVAEEATIGEARQKKLLGVV
jgi:serine/threonine protein kinase